MLVLVSDHFDACYSAIERYWWRRENPYSTDPGHYPDSLLTQMTLRLIDGQSPGRALDLGAGEGADSIRLARCGYDVTAVEISSVGAEKIRGFADAARVVVKVENADISDYVPDGEFDLIICNGVLHYIEDKRPVLERMQIATRPGGRNVISLWSNFTPVPECHKAVPAFCDDEAGIVVGQYSNGRWRRELLYFERDKPDTAHPEKQEHSHSHIKLIARKLA
jgi:SAM-dependent methyltransferase